MLKSRLKQNFYSELGCSWVALSCSNKDVSLGGVMSRHELRPHVHSACAHFRCLSSKEALGPSLEDARTTIRVPVIGQRARFSMLACALAVTLPVIALSFTTPALADVLLRSTAAQEVPAATPEPAPAQSAGAPAASPVTAAPSSESAANQVSAPRTPYQRRPGLDLRP